MLHPLGGNETPRASCAAGPKTGQWHLPLAPVQVPVEDATGQFLDRQRKRPSESRSRQVDVAPIFRAPPNPVASCPRHMAPRPTQRFPHCPQQRASNPRGVALLRQSCHTSRGDNFLCDSRYTDISISAFSTALGGLPLSHRTTVTPVTSISYLGGRWGLLWFFISQLLNINGMNKNARINNTSAFLQAL